MSLVSRCVHQAQIGSAHQKDGKRAMHLRCCQANSIFRVQCFDHILNELSDLVIDLFDLLSLFAQYGIAIIG